MNSALRRFCQSFVFLAESNVKISPPLLCAESYIAPTWLPGGNAQTIYPYLLRPVAPLVYRRERWELDDGDFIDLDWLDIGGSADTPLVVLFHGLEGSSRSHYVLSLMGAVQKKGWRGVVVHFRGCSGSPNRLPRAYHAGDSAEINRILRQLKQQSEAGGAAARLFAIGVSLGGNALLKWLGEQDTQAGQVLEGAAAVSVPLDLMASGRALDSGFNQVYTRIFLHSLKRKALGKLEQYPDLFDRRKVALTKTLYDFDNLVTAPLHGFRNTDEYWSQSSSKPWLRHIRVPTLVTNARNDPFMPASALPLPEEAASAVTLEFPAQGGHAGFLSPPFPGKLAWLPQRVIGFFEQVGE